MYINLLYYKINPIFTLSNYNTTKVMVYTSYFAMSKKMATHGIMPISISLKPPYWFNGTQMKELAPTAEILAVGRSGDTKLYTKLFLEHLNKLDKQKIVSKLKELSKEDSIALCCYEKKSDFCHRHIVSDWLKDLLKIDEAFCSEEEKKVLLETQKNFW